MGSLRSGYVFEYTGVEPREATWQGSPSDDWDTEVYGPTGAERMLGCKRIDGAQCNVYACPDGVIRARTTVSAGRVPPVGEVGW
jgi:hypothetical protein